jgi:polysaccharide biosynthesis protein PslH
VNILYLVHRAPHPPDKGDRIRSFHLLKHLSSLGRVHLAAFADEQVSESSLQALDQLAARIEIIPVGRARWLKAAFSLLHGESASEGLFSCHRLTATLRRWVSETHFDVAVAFCSSMAPHLAGLPIPRKFVDLVDVDSEKFLQYAEQASAFKRRLYSLEGARVRNLEARIGGFAERVVLATEPEADLYRRIAPKSNVAAVANGVDFNYFARTSAVPEADSCAFVGAMDYRANVECVHWFVDRVWPEVRRLRPNAVFRIVGRNPTSSILALGSRPGVTVTGAVPEVRPYLDRTMVAVAPLRVARGVQNKVLEAMAVGRPVLASPAAAVGLHVNHDAELLLAGEPAEWVQRLFRLWDDAELRARLSDAGRAYVETEHSWDSCLAPWTQWLRQNDMGGSAPSRMSEEFARSGG